MKTRTILFLILASLPLMGSSCIYDPFIVSVNLKTMGHSFRVNTGSGSWNDTSGAIVVQDLIDEAYRDDIVGFRLYDIKVSVSGPHPNGLVSGNGYYRFDNGVERRLLSFSGQYSDYEAGVSLLNPAGLVTYDPTGLPIFLSALNDIHNLPTVVRLRSSGSGPAVTSNFNVNIDIYIQADAQIGGGGGD
jgi:hypothetical protein